MRKTAKRASTQAVALKKIVKKSVNVRLEKGFEHQFTPSSPVFNRKLPVLLTISGVTEKGTPLQVGLMACTPTRCTIALSQTQCELLEALLPKE